MAPYGVLIRTGAGCPRIMPLAGPGRAGMLQDNRSDRPARTAPTRNTVAGEFNQSIPSTAGRITAAIWLIVKATPALEAKSAGSAIF